MKRKRFMGKNGVIKFLALSMALLSGNGLVYADSTPVIAPSKANGKTILFDNAHAQTAGAADWVIDGAFSDFAEGLAKEGYYVKELRKASGITYSDLSGVDVFVIPEANVPFKVFEQQALVRYVEEGGSILFIADHYNADRNKNRWDSSEVFNGYRRGAFDDPTKGMNAEEKNSAAMQGVKSSDWLATEFGVRFRYNALGDLSANNIVAPKEAFNITKNINSVAMHAGSTLAIINPQVAKGIVYVPDDLKALDKWSSAVDQGVYNGGGVEEGAYVAIAKKGKGKAAFIGDSSLVEDATPKYLNEENGKSKKTYDGYKEEDNARLLMQLTSWLGSQEDYTNFAEQGITLDVATSLYDFEIPKQSTEPAKEPWATPSSGYKWHDSSTFASGAYKYVADTSTKPTNLAESKNNLPAVGTPVYSIIRAENLKDNEEMALTVRVTNMKAGQKLSNVRVGAYLNGGTQIGLFMKEDGTYPNQYGYSEYFDLTANEDGVAYKNFVFKIKKGVAGNANLRIKVGSRNVLTETITIK